MNEAGVVFSCMGRGSPSRQATLIRKTYGCENDGIERPGWWESLP